jgi:D-arabinose 1-dehydrogenase-like Zn-dependent alcohol dehydrogenase
MSAQKFTVFKGSESNQVVRGTIEKKVAPNEVFIKVTHSGLCGTDCHYKHAAMALGHEGVGVVEEVGSACNRIKKGDVVGWGYQHSSCGHCHNCLNGTEIFCSERKMYGSADLDQGSLATGAVWREDFVFKIPSSIKPSAAAPLMCGGATVFAALYNTNTRPTDTVGIIGVGGLGHLAIAFAAKMGCRVVVFSSTDSKKEEAIRLGATEFYATKGKKELEIPHKLNTLLVTTSMQPDWHMYFNLMAPEGVVLPLSVSFGDLVAPYMELLQRGLNIKGSIVASRYVQ